MKAAEGGHPLAMQQVSEMYRDGVGEKNEELSAYWLQRQRSRKER